MANDQTAKPSFTTSATTCHNAQSTGGLNALNPAMRNELSDAVMSGERDDVRVIVITGAGGVLLRGDVKAMNGATVRPKTDLGETVAPVVTVQCWPCAIRSSIIAAVKALRLAQV